MDGGYPSTVCHELLFIVLQQQRKETELNCTFKIGKVIEKADKKSKVITKESVCILRCNPPRLINYSWNKRILKVIRWLFSIVFNYFQVYPSMIHKGLYNEMILKDFKPVLRQIKPGLLTSNGWRLPCSLKTTQSNPLNRLKCLWEDKGYWVIRVYVMILKLTWNL